MDDGSETCAMKVLPAAGRTEARSASETPSGVGGFSLCQDARGRPQGLSHSPSSGGFPVRCVAEAWPGLFR
jgi:hypothetical protein